MAERQESNQQVIEYVGVDSSDYCDTYQFQKPDDEFPYAEVTIYSGSIKGQRIIAGGPYRIDDSTALKSKPKLRAPGSVGFEMRASIPAGRQEEAAAHIARCIFSIYEIKEGISG
jgi:hypothetical protein